MKKSLAIFATVFLTGYFAIAQDTNTASHQVSITVPTVSLVDIEGPGGSNSINLVFTAPTEAGLGLVAPQPNSDLWLNLTSTAKNASEGKSVHASMTGTLPKGIDLILKTDNATTGYGNIGSAGTEIILDGTNQTVIKGIRSGFTGNGVSNGFQLTYTLDFNDEDYATLYNDISALTITYTMTGE
jgi:hypothetical protein